MEIELFIIEVKKLGIEISMIDQIDIRYNKAI